MSIKAFELVPALERSKLMSESGKREIECIDCCGKSLFIGTNDCFVIHYSIEESKLPNGRTSFTCKKQAHKYLNLKKPINKVKAATALNCLIVLCDNTITLLNIINLEVISGPKVKNVSAFCVNHNPAQSNPFSIELAVAVKKKQIQMYVVTEEKILPQRDINIPEPAIALAMDGTNLCIATSCMYYMINLAKNQTVDLFPYQLQTTTPFIISISRSEFLLSAPSALGMFVTSNGISKRPPLQWGNSLASISYSHPYVLALNDEFITMHSILDQQQKQSVPFSGGIWLGEFDGLLLVCSAYEVYSLVPIPIEKQIQGLLDDKRIEEALELAKNVRKTGMPKEKFLKMYQRIQLQAGFIQFQQMHFDAAKDLLSSGKLDPRELICLYPFLMPSSSTYARSCPALHEIADINQLSHGEEETTKDFKHFLLSYLALVRNTHVAQDCKMEVDTALLKLYSELEPHQIVTLIVSENSCDSDDCQTFLEKYGHYHASALLFAHSSQPDKALAIWIRLEKGEIHDELYPGLGFLVEYLANLSDQELVWQYADLIMNRNQLLGVKIFTERNAQEEPTERMRADNILDYLNRFSEAVLYYLEYLVYKKKYKNEKYHSHLAMLYLEQVLELMKTHPQDAEQIENARVNLQILLQKSDFYQVNHILNKIKETDLYPEMAILHSKLGEHDKALEILVHKLHDFVRAERYCLINSKGKEPSLRKRLFQTLLNVYLQPSNQHQDVLMVPAIELLNKNQAHFDTVKVLEMIPENWSVGLVSKFLNKAIRASMHNRRTTQVESMLARSENLQVKHENLQLISGVITLNEDKFCAVCNNSFTETSFVRYPNGVLCHPKCASNQSVCPVTGKVFGTICKDSEKTAKPDSIRDKQP